MTQLVLNIENQELADTLQAFSLKQKKTMEEIAIEAIKNFIETSKKKDKPVYAKKDFTKNMQVIKKEFDENLCDDKALTYITESASYIHNLRRHNSVGHQRL
jgi:hypothetical protein